MPSQFGTGFLLRCSGVALVRILLLAYYSPVIVLIQLFLFSFFTVVYHPHFFHLQPPSARYGGTGNSSTFYLHVGYFSDRKATPNAFSAAHRSTFAVRTLNIVGNAVFADHAPPVHQACVRIGINRHSSSTNSYHQFADAVIVWDWAVSLPREWTFVNFHNCSPGIPTDKLIKDLEDSLDAR